MKYIKTYKIFENSNLDLISELDKYGIENYIINDDQSIDVDDDVGLCSKKLEIVPFKFNKVSGSFDCFNNNLNSLEGSPLEVGGNFDCCVNKLTSLEYCPTEVIGSFYCSSNKLISLQYCPSEIGSDFICYNNKLESLEYCPSEIGKNFYCSNNKLTMLDCSSYVKGNIYCYGMFTEEPEFFGDCEGKIIWK